MLSITYPLIFYSCIYNIITVCVRLGTDDTNASQTKVKPICISRNKRYKFNLRKYPKAWEDFHKRHTKNVKIVRSWTCKVNIKKKLVWFSSQYVLLYFVCSWVYIVYFYHHSLWNTEIFYIQTTSTVPTTTSIIISSEKFLLDSFIILATTWNRRFFIFLFAI